MRLEELGEYKNRERETLSSRYMTLFLLLLSQEENIYLEDT